MALATATELKPDLHTHVSNIETPAVVVDLDQMEQNLSDYGDFAQAHDVTLRSHAKTHKVPDIAHLQQEYGQGICCQTLSEAEVMAATGIDDIYLSYMVAGEDKLDRLVRLSESVPSFATTVDGEGNLRPLQAAANRHGVTVDVMLEVDIGLHRVGVKPGQAAVELAETIDARSNIRLAGVMAYEGHLAYGADRPESLEELEQRCLEAMDELADTVEQIEATGIPVDDVGVGSTATAKLSGKHPIVTEIHPGMYPFMDANLAGLPGIERDDCALTVHSTVISTAVTDQVVVDAGSKSISLEIDVDPICVSDDGGIEFVNASEEHGWIDITDTEQSFSVGDRLEFIPPHVCPTINLHETLIGTRQGEVETVWSILGRGKVK